MVPRLAILALAQGLDLVTFVLMVARHGPSAEANPLVAGLFLGLGLPALVVAKIALVVLVGSLRVASVARGGHGVWAPVGGVPLAMAIGAGIIGGISNAATLR